MLKHRITTLFFLTVIFLLALWGLFAAMPIWYFAIAGALWFLVVLTGSSYIGSNYHVKTYCSNPDEKERKIALTFDDGPNENTLEILKVLEKHQAKAAFFCIGQNVATHPEILKKIVSDGHIVANHSYSHSHFIDFYRKDRMISELEKTDAIIEELTGKKVRFFRPPYGVTNPSIRRALEITKHKVIGWNIRSLDGIISNKKIILNRIVKRIAPGAIVLLHDTKHETVQVLEQLLLIAAEKKYEIVSIEQLLNLKAYEN